jgi:hypothetical protein
VNPSRFKRDYGQVRAIGPREPRRLALLCISQEGAGRLLWPSKAIAFQIGHNSAAKVISIKAVFVRECVLTSILTRGQVWVHWLPRGGMDGSTMREGTESRMLRLESQRKLAALSLKRCPLCGAVNAVANDECFVCRWYGEFERDPDSVDEGLGELLNNCPELIDAMLSEPPKPPTLLQRIKAFFGFRSYRHDPLLEL